MVTKKKKYMQNSRDRSRKKKGGTVPKRKANGKWNKRKSPVVRKKCHNSPETEPYPKLSAGTIKMREPPIKCTRANHLFLEDKKRGSKLKDEEAPAQRSFMYDDEIISHKMQ